MTDPGDWRLFGQEKYLKGVTLVYKQYADRKTGTDHDHCEFCFEKFSDTIPDALQAGYAADDDYRWICEKCFQDFKEMFRFKIEA
jgi:hypothetical protein